MLIKKNSALAPLLLIFIGAFFAAPPVNAQSGEYKQIVRHLKTKYQAKKVKIPLMWLARFAVSVARPAGVKSFSVTLFNDLKFSRETLDAEMQTAMKNSFGADWSPVLRVRSRRGEQIYMYMCEAGKNFKIAVVTIDKSDAAVIRATFSPERLSDFINDPKIFGISLSDDEKPANGKTAESKEIAAAKAEKENQPRK